MSDENEKPLFIALRAEYYDAFARGEKQYEYRPRGSRWNAETCRIGRRVILSRGYGRASRMAGVITGFHFDTIPSRLPGWTDCYGSRGGDAACIRIALNLLGKVPTVADRPQRRADDMGEPATFQPFIETLRPHRMIVCAALRSRHTSRIVCGARHFDAIMRGQIACAEGIAVWKDAEQGFIDQFGTFVSREEALELVLASGQTLRGRYTLNSRELFSENLY